MQGLGSIVVMWHWVLVDHEDEQDLEEEEVEEEEWKKTRRERQ